MSIVRIIILWVISFVLGTVSSTAILLLIPGDEQFFTTVIAGSLATLIWFGILYEVISRWEKLVSYSPGVDEDE